MTSPRPSGTHPPDAEIAEQAEPGWLDRLLAKFGLGEEPDLRALIEDALARSKDARGALSLQQRVMLLNILRFGELRVDDVMVPRADIVAVEESTSIAELLRVFRQAEHSRLPVYRETLDDPRGMVHIRDVVSWITTEAENGNFNLSAVHLNRSIAEAGLIREILYVPASMSVLDLLLRMQTTRLHLALVVDEYGGTDGLVSIEDLVEEVVGEIEDEHDVSEEPQIIDDPRLGLIIDARTRIEDLEQHLGRRLLPPEEEDIDTLGGLVFSICGRVPARGELVPHGDDLEFEVLDADPRRIKKVRVHRRPVSSQTRDAEGGEAS